MHRFVTYLVILILCSQLSLFAAYAYEGSQLVCPLLSTPVTIDGKWTTSGEWSDAAMILLPKSFGSSLNATAYLYTKHDESNLYFLVDFVSATSLAPSTDGAGITLDPLHNGGNIAQSDDRRFDSSSGISSMAIGTGAGWKWGNALPAGVEVRMSMTNSTNLARSHEVSEFKIPLSIFSQLQSTVGFDAAAYSGGYQGSPNFKLATWPKDSYQDIPVTWGELTFSAEPVPEFSSAWLIIGVAMLTVLVLTRSGRKVEKRLHLP